MRRLADGLQDIERAAGVGLEVVERPLEAGGHRDLSGEVEDVRRAAHGVAHRRGIARVGDAHLDAVAVLRAQPVEIALHAGAGQVVVKAHPLSGGEVAMEFGDHDRHLGRIEVEAQCRTDRSAEQSVDEVHTRGLRSPPSFHAVNQIPYEIDARVSENSDAEAEPDAG